MKKYLLLALPFALWALIAQKSKAQSCASCVTPTLQLEYLGAPKGDESAEYDKIEDWSHLNAVQLGDSKDGYVTIEVNP